MHARFEGKDKTKNTVNMNKNTDVMDFYVPGRASR